MARMLKLSDQEFKTAVINILSALINELDSVQELMGNMNREKDILRKSQK